MRCILCTIFLISACGAVVSGQTLTHRPPAPASSAPAFVDLALPAGAPLQVALDKEVRIQKVGQPVHAKVVEPAYAFDKLVIPVGSEVIGKISEIKPVSAKTRTRAAIDVNFSPHRDIGIQFDELVLPDGRHLAIQTVVTPGSAGVLQFSTAKIKEEKQSKETKAKQAAAAQVSATKQEIKREWDAAKAQISEPGKIHRLERFGLAQLPVHPQYMETGTRFNAELQQPLDFGHESLTAEQVSAIGTPPPDGSIVHALLVTPLSSAESKKGGSVEAVITEPLFVSDHLVMPQGSRLVGSVLEVHPARKFHRNGQLRVVFHQVVPPGGLEQKVEASLEGVEATKDQRLKLDSEGGAEVTSSKTRYATTAISIALAARSFHSDIDNGAEEHPGGTFAGRASNGGNGLGLVGIILGALVHSRALASGLGVYGAAMSVYAHFLAHGRDVVYPKDTAMAIGIGTRPPAPSKIADSPAAPEPLPLLPLRQH